MVDGEKLRIVGWAVAALVTVLLAVHLLDARGGGHDAAAVSVAPGPAPGGSGPSGASGAGPGRADVLVQVAGEVARPGVYRVPAGSRVTDAVERAGGLTRRADQAGVNLVARVQDGQQVVVPRRGPGGVSMSAGVGATASGAAGGGGPPPGPVSLPSATPEPPDSLD